MFNKILSSICVLAIFLITSVANANYLVSPVKLELDKKEKITSLHFQNEGATEKNLQVKILKRDMSKPGKVYAPTKDLIASPVIFKVQPNRGQLIRIAIKNFKAKSEKDDYRVSIKEVPQGVAEEGKVRFVTEISVPIKIK